MTNRIPSYKSGYARNAAESANPGLWDGLVGLWQPSLGITGLTLKDVSGHHSHGTNNGATWEPGPRGSVLGCDGASGYVAISATAADAPYSTADVATSGLTQAGWIKVPRNADESEYTLCSGMGSLAHTESSAGGLSVFDGAAWSQAQFTIYDGSYQEAFAASGDGLVGDTWYHLAGVVDPPASLIRLYINGVQVATDTFNAGGTLFEPVFFDIGRMPDGTEYCLGQLDNVPVYSRALTPSEIRHLYEQPNALTTLRRRTFFSTAGGAPPVGTITKLAGDGGGLVGPYRRLVG